MEDVSCSSLTAVFLLLKSIFFRNQIKWTKVTHHEATKALNAHDRNRFLRSSCFKAKIENYQTR